MVEGHADRRELEEQLEVIHREFAVLTSSLSHNLQEPLRMVAGFMDLLQEEYGGQLDDNATEYVAYAADGARRMQAMVEGLVRLSRASSEPVHLGAVQPEDCWLDAQARLRDRIEAAEADLSCDPLPRVEFAPLLLTHIFEVLLDNALRFRGDQPARVHLGARPSKRGWVFCMEDQGTGLPDGNIERAFRPFNTLHPDHPERGTGLGLCLARRILHRQGGRIWLERNEPRGSRACFTARPAREGTP